MQPPTSPPPFAPGSRPALGSSDRRAEPAISVGWWRSSSGPPPTEEASGNLTRTRRMRIERGHRRLTCGCDSVSAAFWREDIAVANQPPEAPTHCPVADTDLSGKLGRTPRTLGDQAAQDGLIEARRWRAHTPASRWRVAGRRNRPEPAGTSRAPVSRGEPSAHAGRRHRPEPARTDRSVSLRGSRPWNASVSASHPPSSSKRPSAVASSR